jgi:hypothetical protein
VPATHRRRWTTAPSASAASQRWPIATRPLTTRARYVHGQRTAAQHTLAQLGHGFTRGSRIPQRNEPKAAPAAIRIHRHVQLQNRTNPGFLEDLRQLVLSAVAGKIREE